MGSDSSQSLIFSYEQPQQLVMKVYNYRMLQALVTGHVRNVKNDVGCLLSSFVFRIAVA